MKFCLWIVLFLFLLNGTLTQDFDLSDAFDDLDFDLSDALDDLVPPTPAKPKEQPKPPKQPDGGFGLDLGDALDPDPKPKPDKPAVKPPKSRGGGGGGGLDLEDALGPGGFRLDLADFFGPEKPTDSPTGGACPKDLDQKLNRIIENQEKLLKLLEQQRPRSSSRFWPTR